MIANPLSVEERRLLLRIARQSIERAACGGPGQPPDLTLLPDRLKEDGATFVTLTTSDGELRGCIGTLEAHMPLAQDVYEHARAAAMEDYRFLPVRPEEVSLLHIEISRLTAPQPLEYERPEELLARLHPLEDGVVLRDGLYRATFLPQVWEKLREPGAFLSHLCQKMGAPGDLWRRKKLHVEVYQVEEFHEEPD